MAEPSSDLRARIKSQGIPAIVAFSRGKDAVAALLALREAGVDAPCYHLDLVPGLRFVDESLADLETQLERKGDR